MTGGASPRRRGDYFERQAKADLESHGWLVVRAGGSLGPCDLIAVSRARQPLLISCKLGGRISPAERQTLATLSQRFGAVAMVASRPSDGVVFYRPVRPDDAAATIER